MGTTRATLLIAVASVGFGCVAFFARELTDGGLAASSVAFYRYIIAAVVLAPWFPIGRAKRRSAAWALGAGLALGAGWIGYVVALERLEVSTVGVIYMTYPLFAIVAAWLVFRHRPRGRALVGGALIVAAAVIALGPAAVDGDDIRAVLYALAAPVTFGLAIAILTERLVSLTSFERIAAASVGALVGTLPVIVWSSRSEVVPSSGRVWALILGIGLATALVPQLLYVSAAPFVGPARAAAAGAIELPTVFVIGWLAFDETVGPTKLVAGALVMSAVLVTPSRPPPAAVVEPGDPG
jgi:drug/metabolite transporter (DMT)-like permease